jgi:predicted porin
MNKSCIVAMAAAGFCSVAAAQSSVTLFGVIDVNVGWIDNNDSTYQLGTNGLSTSRLGFRGTEDMGGGLKAGFWLEGQFDADTGKGASSFGNGTDVDEFAFLRRATVSLLNPYGEIRLGRDNTPTYWAWSNYDPFGATGVGSSQNLISTSNLVEGSGGSYGTLSRANNMVTYFLPGGVTGPGLFGQISVAAGEGDSGNKYYGGRIGYASGPFSVAAAFGVTDVSASGDVTATAWNIGGSWDFGFLKLFGLYNQTDVDGGSFAGSDQDNWMVGATAPWGHWNFKFSYGGANGGGTLSGADASQWVIGTDYSLSKRTTLYGTYSLIDNDSNANFKVLSASSALSKGNNSQGVQIGVRHTF